MVMCTRLGYVHLKKTKLRDTIYARNNARHASMRIIISGRARIRNDRAYVLKVPERLYIIRTSDAPLACISAASKLLNHNTGCSPILFNRDEILLLFFIVCAEVYCRLGPLLWLALIASTRNLSRRVGIRAKYSRVLLRRFTSANDEGVSVGMLRSAAQPPALDGAPAVHHSSTTCLVYQMM